MFNRSQEKTMKVGCLWRVIIFILVILKTFIILDGQQNPILILSESN